LLDLAPALVRDSQNRVLLWTRGAEQLYGFKKEEVLGRVSHELLQTEFPQPLSEIEKILNAEGAWEGELSHRTRDGKRVVVASQWVLHRDPNGRYIRTLEVSADITALKRAESLQMRSQKLEALGTLASGIAHDFNNILSAINGSAALAISQFPSDHPVQACLLQIEKAGWRATDLVRRILSFSRPQENNAEAQNLQLIVQEALKLVRATLPAMVEIRQTYGSDLPMVVVDTTQICQVVLNLVTNAAHAIGNKAGLVEVKVDAPQVGEDEIQLYPRIPEGRYVRLSVSDNGCGMDTATVERIFDPFFTTKAAGKGTGLGLSVVHGIVAAHRGVVKLYSEPGKGTAVQIYLPAVREVAAPAEVVESNAPVGRGEHVLFVDDEGVLVFVGSMILEQNGYKVAGFSDGEAALREFQQRPDAFDAVITDSSMPAMSGLQFARELRKIRADIPILLSSGYIDPDDQIIAKRLGIEAILTKPVSRTDLLTVLYSVLQERHLRQIPNRQT
jgi:PAS domain S-box-containing protein